MNKQPFFFKNVQGGAAVAPQDFPKLPPSAMRLVLRTLREHNLGTKLDATDPRTAEVMSELGIDLVHLSLRRIQPDLTRAQVADDEDLDVVLRAFETVQERNPTLFPKNKGSMPAEASDPNSAARITSAHSTT